MERTGVLAIILGLNVLFSGPAAAEKAYTLQDAYAAALRTNENVKIAEENVFLWQSRVDQAWTYIYPRVTAQSSFTRYNEQLPPPGEGFVFQPLSQLQAVLVLKQPLYTGGRTLAGLRTAQLQHESSSNDLTAAKQDIMLNAAQAYYGVLKAQELVGVSRRAVERMERHKKVTEREAATRRTKANISALLRATTLVNQARINLVRAEDGLRIVRQQLRLVTNLPADTPITEPQPVEPPAADLEQLKLTALANRPDFENSQLNQKVAEKNITIVRGGHYPQVYAEGGLQYQNSDPETAFDGTIYYGGFRLQIPIFEGGLMKAEISEARSKLRQAQLKVSLLERSIESQVHDAFINLQTLTSVLDTAKLQMKYARENFAAVEGLYAQGLASSLSLIDAEQALLQAEQELVRSAYDRQVAILSLKKSLGILGSES